MVEVSEQASQKLSVPVRANPFVDNLVFSRVKETTPNYTRRLAATDTASATSASRVNALIDDFENISWLVESVPSRWTFSLSLETISLHIDNATITDGGLYMARVSNTLGDSLFFLRLHVKSTSLRFNWQPCCWRRQSRRQC